MQVKMRTQVSGLRNGQPWPPVGGTIDLPDDEALLMLHNGSAEPVYDPESGVETAVMPTAETRDTSARDALVKGAKPKPTRPDPSLTERSR